MTLCTERIRTLDDIRAFLGGNEAADITPHDRAAAYAFIERALVRFKYHFGLSRAGKGLVREFLAKVTGYSDSQLSRLIAQQRRTGHIRDHRLRPPSRPFATVYTTADALLLAVRVPPGCSAAQGAFRYSRPGRPCYVLEHNGVAGSPVFVSARCKRSRLRDPIALSSGDAPAEVSRGFEAHHGAGRNLDRFAGPGVAGRAGFAVSDLERAETPDLDAIALGKRLLHGAEEAVDHQPALPLGDSRSDRIGDLPNKIQLWSSLLLRTGGQTCRVVVLSRPMRGAYVK